MFLFRFKNDGGISQMIWLFYNLVDDAKKKREIYWHSRVSLVGTMYMLKFEPLFEVILKKVET